MTECIRNSESCVIPVKTHVLHFKHAKTDSWSACCEPSAMCRPNSFALSLRLSAPDCWMHAERITRGRQTASPSAPEAKAATWGLSPRLTENVKCLKCRQTGNISAKIISFDPVSFISPRPCRWAVLQLTYFFKSWYDIIWSFRSLDVWIGQSASDWNLSRP